LLAEVIVTTNDGSNDRPLIPQELLERTSWANRSLTYLHWYVSLLLASNTSKELVQVMDYSQWATHKATSGFRSTSESVVMITPPPEVSRDSAVFGIVSFLANSSLTY
jgi:hypothetical protein